MRIRKTRLSIAVAAILNTGITQAAFLDPGSTGSIEVTGACFAWGQCTIGGFGDISANTLQVNGVGSGNGVDIGRMNFTVGADGNSFTLTSFNLSAVTGTAAGTIPWQITTLGNAGGTIDDAGNMELDLSGRTGIMEFFAVAFGEQSWMIDDSTTIASQGDPTTGLQVPFTTGSIFAYDPSVPGSTTLTQTGSALSTAGVGTWTGTLVSSGNQGSAWGPFDGTPFTEIFDVTVTGTVAVVPIPASAWLMGSGLAGLVGVARRRKARR